MFSPASGTITIPANSTLWVPTTATVPPLGNGQASCYQLTLQVPGLGQLYAGRLLRGGLVFGSCIALRHAPWMTPLLFAFTYVFNLFDAYRLAQPREVATRFDDTLFLLIGIGTAALTLLQHGGFFGAQRETLLPLAGYATALLIAHETRR